MSRISVEEAARTMCVSAQFVRIGLQQKAFTWAVKSSAVRMPGGRWSYYIDKEEFERNFNETGEKANSSCA